MMLYLFKVGEERDIGVEISARDGNPFTLSATWEFNGQSGPADINGNNVSTSLSITKAVSPQLCTFTVVITPTDTDRHEQTLVCPAVIRVSS